MTEKDIKELKERNKILEERCNKFRQIIIDSYIGEPVEYIVDLADTYNLSCADARCLMKLPERFEKPPLGIMPRYIWIEARINELYAAITRYGERGMSIPSEWVKELGDLAVERVKARDEEKMKNIFDRQDFDPDHCNYSNCLQCFQESGIDIYYLCDGYGCDFCSKPEGECRYTADINHAVHKDTLNERLFAYQKCGERIGMFEVEVKE